MSGAVFKPGSVFKMVQVSDIHFGGEHPQAVEAAVECIHASGSPKPAPSARPRSATVANAPW